MFPEVLGGNSSFIPPSSISIIQEAFNRLASPPLKQHNKDKLNNREEKKSEGRKKEAWKEKRSVEEKRKGDNNISDARNDGQTEMDIYNKNEEMMPAFKMEVEDAMELDIKSEEVSEDEIEFYINNEISKYEMIMIKFDESNEEDSNDKEETSKKELDEEVIINRPLSNEQLFHL
ncbi:hypothetical protein C1645_839312 [Glomus cerebriforme]|uniref:Uncharacterized protein n=1 Tax=Glomus cerebriforme TaxID=658196 RepID=A0A397SCJ9_9GLOM|nr:hypothetical protein C1645_839312 [Glomus cerebriforme]